MIFFQKFNGSKMEHKFMSPIKKSNSNIFLWCDFSAPAGADHRKLPWRRSQLTTRFLQNKKRAWIFMGFFAVKLPSEFSQQSPRPLCVEMTWWHMGIDLYLGIDVSLVSVCSFHVGKILLQNGRYALCKNEAQHLDLPTSHIFFSNPLGV